MAVDAVETYLGIDFSGNHKQWRTGRTASNVWLARVSVHLAGGANVTELFRVQRCMDQYSEVNPFAALSRFLCEEKFAAAAIDAPFGIPEAYLSESGHSGLVDAMGVIACGKRPFPCGDDLLTVVRETGRISDVPERGCKTYRQTEQYWLRRGLNVRSAMWNDARGGAPFASACLTLLSRTRVPVWPWTSAESADKLLVEAYPAAQLYAWNLPHFRYNGSDDEATRRRTEIINLLEATRQLNFDSVSLKQHALESADAVDAVLCSFAGVAVVTSKLESEPPNNEVAEREGWIAVHRQC